MTLNNATPSPVVMARNLSKSYRGKPVLSGLDLKVAENQLCGLLGKNGTGKSTLLSMIAGQIRNSGGELQVFDQSPFDSAEVMEKIVYAGIDIPFPASWRVRTIVEAAALRYPAWHQPTASSLGEEFALDAWAKYGELSRGQRSMVGIIIGLAARAPLTLLDEPYLGLDVQNRKVFYTSLLRELEEHPRTTILATHHIEESAKLLDTFLILGWDGRLNHDCTAEELAEDYVSVAGTSLPLIDAALTREDVAGRSRMIIPRRELGNLDHRAARIEPAEPGEVITALLEGA